MLRVFPAHDKLVLQLFLRKSQHLFLKWKVVEIMWRHTFFLLDTRNGERSPLASGNLSDEKKEVLMKQLRFVSECHRFYIIILFVCFKILRRSQRKSQLGHFRVIKYLPFKTKSSEKYFRHQTLFYPRVGGCFGIRGDRLNRDQKPRMISF